MSASASKGASISFEKCVRVSHSVSVSDLDGEPFILNRESSVYFGLDAVAARMWAVVVASESIEVALCTLATEFDIVPCELRNDLEQFLVELLEYGLVELAPGARATAMRGPAEPNLSHRS